MDRFDSMRLLVRVVERQSFSAAASDLGVPRSSATTSIKQFEERLGVRLLQRTTRHVTPTLEGEIYYRRCTAARCVACCASTCTVRWRAPISFPGCRPS